MSEGEKGFRVSWGWITVIILVILSAIGIGIRSTVNSLLELLFLMAVYTIVALSLNLEAGFFDIPNFGKAVFAFIGAWAAVGIGGNITAVTIQHLYPETTQEVLKITGGSHSSLLAAYLDHSYSTLTVQLMNKYLLMHPYLGLAMLLVALLGAIAIGGVLGLIAAYPALRLREDYLAILLLSFSELTVMNIFYQTPSLLGPQGLWVPYYLAIFKTTPKMANTMIAFAIIAAILIFMLSERLANSPMGRLMRAVRDNELAAETFGKDIVSIRKKVIIFTSAMAALGGFFVAVKSQTVQALNFHRIYYTFYPWAMMIVGGMGNNIGTVIGVVVIWLGVRLINVYQVTIGNLFHMPLDAVTQLDKILLGVLMLLILYTRPEGIVPEKMSKTTDFEELADVSWRLEHSKIQEHPKNIGKKFLRKERRKEMLMWLIILIILAIWIVYII
ncbi:MAG: branched-chain amino acid ABC transporter permease [Desulfurococcales archaeon]|nr:branched-chain amino acid ABC transporter permease [Desulfurococcales archaeon]